MGSANQVPYGLAGYDARDIRRGVLVLAADLCTIISQVLAQLMVLFSSGHMSVIRCVACENGPDDPGRLVRHSNSGDARGFAFEQ